MEPECGGKKGGSLGTCVKGDEAKGSEPTGGPPRKMAHELDTGPARHPSPLGKKGPNSTAKRPPESQCAELGFEIEKKKPAKNEEKLRDIKS